MKSLVSNAMSWNSVSNICGSLCKLFRFLLYTIVRIIISAFWCCLRVKGDDLYEVLRTGADKCNKWLVTVSYGMMLMLMTTQNTGGQIQNSIFPILKEMIGNKGT